MSVVTIDSANDSTSLIAITTELRDARQGDANKPIFIDFSQLRGKQAAVPPAWGNVLSNILASNFGDTPMGAALPADHLARVQLARAGVYFALARNRHFDWTSLRDGTHDIVRRWKRNWEPAEVQQPLFNVTETEDAELAPTTLEPAIVAFLNPDRLMPTNVDDGSKPVIYPWLRGLVGNTPAGASRLDRGLQQDISLVIFELLGNVREHARLSPHQLCSLSLFVTEGSTGPRLYITVFDTGVGMPHALSKIPFATAVPATERVAAAFNGQLPNRERDRGRGLHRIAGLVARLSGKLFVATGPSDQGAVVIEHQAKRESAVSARFVPDLPVVGAVVMITLPLPRSANSRRDPATNPGKARSENR